LGHCRNPKRNIAVRGLKVYRFNEKIQAKPPFLLQNDKALVDNFINTVETEAIPRLNNNNLT
jgi:hypothetical protein